MRKKPITLTPREKQVRELTEEGKTSREIAAALGIAAGTVKLHRSHIAIKLSHYQPEPEAAAMEQDPVEQGA